MADDRLRLVAEVTDQFSTPLDRLNAKLRTITQSGAQAGKDLRKDFDGFHASIGKANGALDGMLNPLRSLGVVSLGAGLGLAGIATSIREFSRSTQQITILSKETGLAVDQLRAFGTLGERFGVSAQTMQSGVRNFSEEMDRLRKRYGETYSSLQAMNLGELVEKLVSAPNMQAALDAAMQALEQIDNPVRRRKVAEMLFGTGDIGVIAGQVSGKYREMMDEIVRMQGTLDEKTQASATRFEKNMSRIGEAFDRVKNKYGGAVLDGIVGAIEDFEQRGILGSNRTDPNATPPTAQDEDLDAQIRGQRAQSPSQKRAAEIQARLAEKQGELAYQQRRFPVRDEAHIRALSLEIQRLTEELRKSRESGAAYSPSSFNGAAAGGGGARIFSAGYGGGAGFGGGLGPYGGGSSFAGGIPPSGIGPGGGGGMGGGGVPRGAGPGVPGGGVPPVSPVPPAPPPGAAPDGSLFGVPVGPNGSGGSPGGYQSDDATVDGKKLKYAAYSAAGAGRINSWLSFFQRPTDQGGMGMPLGRARAMVAMMQGESGENLNPAAQGDYADPRRKIGPTAFGSAQWRLERFTALKALAAKMGKDWTDVGVQQQHLRNEMLHGNYQGAYRAIMGAGSDEEALAEGIKRFERPKYPEAAARYRQVHLNRLRKYNMTGAGGGTGNEGGGYRQGMSRLRDTDIDHVGSGSRMGDDMMRRRFGMQGVQMPEGATGGGKGSLSIEFVNPPAGMRPRASMDDLFHEVEIKKTRQVESASP